MIVMIVQYHITEDNDALSSTMLLGCTGDIHS